MKAPEHRIGGVTILDSEIAYANGLAAALLERGDAVRALPAADGDGLPALDGDSFDALVIDPAMHTRRCLRLISAVHRRGGVGVLAMTSNPSPQLVAALAACGADLVLGKPVPVHEALLAIDLIRRPRAVRVQGTPVWRLERRRRRLVAPGGAEVHVSAADQRLLECFAHAGGDVVTREHLKQVVGRGHDVDLNACVYRLRRRISAVAGTPLPLRSKSRDGYVFSGWIEVDPLAAAEDAAAPVESES